MTQRSMPDLEGVTHEYVQAGGVKIHVAVAGPEGGRPVVLLHGWPENWFMWHKVIPTLANAGYRVHAMDLRGAGWSEVTPKGYEKEQFASDVLAAATALAPPWGHRGSHAAPWADREPARRCAPARETPRSRPPAASPSTARASR